MFSVVSMGYSLLIHADWVSVEVVNSVKHCVLIQESVLNVFRQPVTGLRTEEIEHDGSNTACKRKDDKQQTPSKHSEVRLDTNRKSPRSLVEPFAAAVANPIRNSNTKCHALRLGSNQAATFIWTRNLCLENRNSTSFKTCSQTRYKATKLNDTVTAGLKNDSDDNWSEPEPNGFLSAESIAKKRLTKQPKKPSRL
ncbi:hypothetical protein KL936_002410 [Ogataea polymorpha]|nr:hypothetical protein KL936_002410 [Ogataea polymorpha]